MCPVPCHHARMSTERYGRRHRANVRHTAERWLVRTAAHQPALGRATRVDAPRAMATRRTRPGRAMASGPGKNPQRRGGHVVGSRGDAASGDYALAGLNRIH